MKNSVERVAPTWPGRDVHIWSFDLTLPSGTIQKLKKTLSEDEIARADRFRFKEDHDQAIITHGCLRNILALYLKAKPAQLRFSSNNYGKPALAAAFAKKGLSFNLSHSHGLGLLAVAQARAVGVDIEYMRDNLAYLEIARRFFSPHEVSDLEGLPQAFQKEAFFHCWTRKEALIKAIGHGLFMPLDSFDVSLKPDEPAVLLTTRPDPEEASKWRLYHLDVGANYAGALAAQGSVDKLCYFNWIE